MSAIAISSPFAQFFDLDGLPLDSGRLFIGKVGANPKLAANQIPVYWDAAFTQPAAQPLITSNGYIYRSGTPANVYVDEDFSIAIYNKRGLLVAYLPVGQRVLSAPDGAENIGFIQDGIGAKVRDLLAKVRENVSGPDFTDWQAALQLNAAVSLPGGDYTFTGTVSVSGDSSLVGGRGASITGLTETTNDFGLSLTDAGSLRTLKINATSTASGTVNGRSNSAIVIGAQQASSSAISRGWRLESLQVTLNDTNAVVGNTVAGFGDVSQGEISQLNIDTNSNTGLQFHWGYGLDGYSKHPRSITAENVTVNGLRTRTTGAYLSGCHDVTYRGFAINNCSQGVIVGAGDVGEGANPDPASKGRVMGGLTLERITVYDPVNDPLLVSGASFVLGAARDPLFPNQRWIAADYGYTGISIRDFRVIRGDNSTNSSCSVLHMRNVDAQIYTGLSTAAQATDTHEALSVTSVCDSHIDLHTECVVAFNGLSGKNITLDSAHKNSDVDNIRQQNAIVIRGEIRTAVVRDAVAIGARAVVLQNVTCDVHKGMLFEYGGRLFEFDGHARYEPARPANNVGVRIPIKPAPIAIPASASIEQYYCLHDVKVDGIISGAHKGVRVISTDARVPFNLEINAAFENTINADIEVPLGIRIKRNGVFYYHDTGGTMTFLNGQPVQTQVIGYQEINGRRIGVANALPTTGGMWPAGSVLYRRAPAANTSPGWVCVTAGVGGAAVWKTMAAVAA